MSSALAFIHSQPCEVCAGATALHVIDDVWLCASCFQELRDPNPVRPAPEETAEPRLGLAEIVRRLTR